jgi:excisionase family DNA binding protein
MPAEISHGVVPALKQDDSTPTTAPRRMMRVKEAASVYGVGVSTLWLWAQQGRIKPVRMGKRLTLFPVDQLEALFSTHSL